MSTIEIDNIEEFDRLMLQKGLSKYTQEEFDLFLQNRVYDEELGQEDRVELFRLIGAEILGKFVEVNAKITSVGFQYRTFEESTSIIATSIKLRTYLHYIHNEIEFLAGL